MRRDKIRRQGFEAKNAKTNAFAPMMPTPARPAGPSKELLRERADDALAAFWNAGGKITKLPPGEKT